MSPLNIPVNAYLERALRVSEQKAQEAKKSYQSLKSKLFRLSSQLAIHQRSLIPSVDEFSSDPDEVFFREAMRPWVDLIAPLAKRLKLLEDRYDELEAGLTNFVPKSIEFSDDELLNDDIGEHLTTALQTEEQEREFDVACRLLEKIEAAIKLKKAQISDLQACFVEALSMLIDAYTSVGMKKTAKDLKMIFDASTNYRRRVTQICSKVAGDAGVQSDAAFHPASRSLPTRMDIIFTDRDTVRAVEKFIREHNQSA